MDERNRQAATQKLCKWLKPEMKSGVYTVRSLFVICGFSLAETGSRKRDFLGSQ